MNQVETLAIACGWSLLIRERPSGETRMTVSLSFHSPSPHMVKPMSAAKKKKKSLSNLQTFGVGSTFKLFKKGNTCKVVAVENGKVKFESDSGMTGSFPIAKLGMHV